MKKQIMFIYRASTVKEEVEEVWQILSNYKWYKINNYYPILPKNNEINRFIQLSIKQKSLHKKNKNKLKAIIEESYNKEIYKKEIHSLKSISKVIDRNLPKLVKYNRLWKFRLLKRYEIVLTLYGTEGAYDTKTGSLFILIRKGEKNQRNYFLQTIIHEMIHIGLENFVKKFRLTHDENERIVDLFCQTGLKLKNYKLQSVDGGPIDRFIIPHGFRNLPMALNKYVKNYPREDMRK